MSDAAYIVDLLGLSEDEVVKSFLSAFVPLQPGVLRPNWQNNRSHANSAPATREIWQKFVDADFKCSLCGSHRRITLDHVDGNATNHTSANLRVVCYDCDRKVSSKGTQDEDAQLRIFRAFVSLHARLGRYPTNKEILAESKVQQIEGASRQTVLALARWQKDDSRRVQPEIPALPNGSSRRDSEPGDGLPPEGALLVGGQRAQDSRRQAFHAQRPRLYDGGA